MFRSIACAVAVAVAVAVLLAAEPTGGAEPPPNVVVIFTDDQGYGDVGCFGARDVRTPNLDALAAQGTRFSDFYVAQAVCTASRAALLSGCYPNRVGLQGALNHTSNVGINPSERLLPELLKARGYATAIFGKWHLGHRPMFLPTRHGFDEFAGIPYSNDNGPLHPVVRDIPGLPFFEGETITETDPDQSRFTARFTERAVKFIDANRERPFFLYLPHVMPHVPIFASDRFRGKSARGLYGDVIEELDWSVGEVLAALKRNKLDERTLVIFASDNGPFLSYGTHAGSAGRLREGKLTTFEGGVRVPMIARWPGRVPAGAECREPIMAIDLLPTLAALAGAELPSVTLDGRDVRPLLHGEPNAKSPHEALFFYAGDELQAVRSGDWKLHFAHEYLSVAGEPGRDGKPANFAKLQPKSITLSGIRGIASRHGYEVRRIERSLYNLRDDPGETRDVSAEHPEIVARLEKLAERAREQLGDSLTGRTGSGLRPVGRVP